jgi:hypothetical protein
LRIVAELLEDDTMTKILSRLVFGLWLIGAPMLLVGCGEDSSKPTTPAPSTTPAPGGGTEKPK